MASRGARRTTPPLVVFYLLTAVTAMAYGSIYALLADIRDDFGIGDAGIGLIAFAGFGAGFLAQVVLARFADRGYTGTMVRIGLAMAALGMAWMLVATGLWEWVGARLLVGLGSGTVGPAVRRLVITRDPENVGVNLGRQTAFDMAGFVLGPLVAVVFAELVGFRAPFAVMTALYAGLLVALGRFDLHAGGTSTTKGGILHLVRMPAVQAALCSTTAFYLTVGVFEALWAVLMRDLGAETWLIGVTLSLFTVPMIVFAPRGGRAAQTRGPLAVATVSLSIAAVCTVVYGIAPLWGVVGILFVQAIVDSYTMPANQLAMAQASPPEMLATGQGLLGAAGLAVAGTTALVAGVVYETAGRGAAFTGTAVLMVGFILAARWRRAVADADADTDTVPPVTAGG